MAVVLYNTWSGKKEELQTLKPKEVGMYVCGVTVYDMCHIGHARAYITADVIARYLAYREYQVKYVRNFTDVDDKIINRAKELKITPGTLAERYIQEFNKDMEMLGIQRPDVEPKVTDHIEDIIRLVATLVDKGHAYSVGGDVYFDVNSFPSYGRLSRRNLDELKTGARIEVDERKKSPLDFALWKASKPGEPFWSSPWGEGRPGWHIECSTMSTKYLGDTFDIHGGGMDLIFPHHENEVAQSEAATGKPFCRYFFHNGFVNIDKEKMSKSLGNFFTIREICERYEPEALRYFLLTTHYRTPINFEVSFCCPVCQSGMSRAELEDRKCPHCINRLTEEQAAKAVHFPSLEESQRRLHYLYTTKGRLDEFLLRATTGAGDVIRHDQLERLRDKFEKAMDDDFNTAAALGVLSELMRWANELLDNKDREQESLITSTVQVLMELLDSMASSLGIVEREADVALKKLQERVMTSTGVQPEEIRKLLEERNLARKNKDFQRADEIRKELTDKGIELMDGPQGTTWKVVG